MVTPKEIKEIPEFIKHWVIPPGEEPQMLDDRLDFEGALKYAEFLINEVGDKELGNALLGALKEMPKESRRKSAA